MGRESIEGRGKPTRQLTTEAQVTFSPEALASSPEDPSYCN